MAFYSGAMFNPAFFAASYFGQLYPIAPLSPALPSSRRRAVVYDDVVYLVDDFDYDEEDVITFDFSHRLSPASLPDVVETIAEVLEFVLVSDTDPLVSARVLGIAGFEESLVSQRFGNWLQPGPYSVTCRIRTTRNNILGASASFMVNPEN